MSCKTFIKENNITFDDLNCSNELKDLLYYLYLEDSSFPRSCGVVSMIMTYILQNSMDTNIYDINYVRGQFRNDFQIDERCDDIAEDFEINRESNLNELKCCDCDCDYMTHHSWIEITNKESKQTTIVDFTSIQFEEDFPDYQEEILDFHSDFDFNSAVLFDYMKEKSNFIISTENENYLKYIKSEEELTGEYVKENIFDMSYMVEDILSFINYKK